MPSTTQTRPHASIASKIPSGLRTLYIQELVFQARLGILDKEIGGTQAVRVDAALQLGTHPLEHDPQSREIAIQRVLDYRLIRQIILEEGQKEHVFLLEDLLGKICARLIAFPQVDAISVKLTKLEIFPDCQVAIQMNTGNWLNTASPDSNNQTPSH